MRRVGLILAIVAVGLECGCRTARVAPVAFFPAGFFNTPEHPDTHDFLEKWYGGNLAALKEPALYARRGQPPAYRFLWLRTFDHPWSFRVEVAPDGTGRVFVKKSDGKGGYAPGRLVLSRTIVLSRAQVERLRSLLVAADYWELPRQVYLPILDGSQWIVEAHDGMRYHAVDRQSPGGVREAWRTPGYLELCRYFRELAGVVLSDEEDY